MKKIIFLSDLHIGHDKKEALYTKKIFNKITERHPGTPVIIAGDLTDSGTREQFVDALWLLKKLCATNPVLTVPGNHDYAWKGNVWQKDAWEHWLKYLGSPLGWPQVGVLWMTGKYEPEGVYGVGVWKDGDCVYFGIDSGDPKDKQFSAMGHIDDEQASALLKSLEKYKSKTRIAILHHHPFTEKIFTGLHGSTKLMKALKGNCELLLFGHKHEYGIWWDKRGLPLTVSSHKSTSFFSGNCLTITVIEIENPGMPDVSFHHRLEVV